MLAKIHTCPILLSSSFACKSICPFDSANSLLTNGTLALRVIQIPLSRKWLVHARTEIEDAALSSEENSSWDACRAALSGFEFSTEEENKILGKAFGHLHSPYWTEERGKEVPRVEAVVKVLNYLRSLNLSDGDITKLVKKFPEVLGCDLDDELKKSVEILDKEWGIQGNTLKKLLLRNPKVLGYNVDCKGDCLAKCTRCWVRF